MLHDFLFQMSLILPLRASRSSQERVTGHCVRWSLRTWQEQTAWQPRSTSLLALFDSSLNTSISSLFPWQVKVMEYLPFLLASPFDDMTHQVRVRANDFLQLTFLLFFSFLFLSSKWSSNFIHKVFSSDHFSSFFFFSSIFLFFDEGERESGDSGQLSPPVLTASHWHVIFVLFGSHVSIFYWSSHFLSFHLVIKLKSINWMGWRQSRRLTRHWRSLHSLFTHHFLFLFVF